tara:strand:+ start:12285 stop:12860 length:576 start_codon:yes stop_codon:yes gene_type:complete
MVKILASFPFVVGGLCILIAIGSLVGIDVENSRTDVPIVPCSDESVGCTVGMTTEDLEVPNAFILLEISMELEWDEPDRSWIGVISDYPNECEPDSNGLTTCTSEDFDFVAGGPDSKDGVFKFTLKPGEYRFVTAGKDGSTLDEQLVTINPEIHLAGFVEIILLAIGFTLLLGASQMAFPLREMWKRFRDA